MAGTSGGSSTGAKPKRPGLAIGTYALPKENDDYVLGELLGSGTFGSVFKATHKPTDAAIAIKSYRMRLTERSHFPRSATEAAFMRLLDHPNIISFICFFLGKYYIYLGMEYSPYGTLGTFINKSGPNAVIPEETVKTIMRQIFAGLGHMHSMSIFHGDIKPDNIIVFEETQPIIKITDFGLAEIILRHQSIRKKAGSFFFMSPELHLGFPVDCTSDLFSAGMIMYEMVYGYRPFPTKTNKEEHVKRLRNRVVISFPETSVSEDCRSLVKNLLSYDKENRLSGSDLMAHPFLSQEPEKDETNHYIKAYQCLLTGAELADEMKFGEAYFAITQASLHLQIFISKIDDVSLYRYIVLRIREYQRFCERMVDRIINEDCTTKFEMQTDTEKLRCMLHSSPEMGTAYDLCAIGEMLYGQQDYTSAKANMQKGLHILMEKFKLEPEGERKRLLGLKMDVWVALLENTSPTYGFTSH